MGPSSSAGPHWLLSGRTYSCRRTDHYHFTTRSHGGTEFLLTAFFRNVSSLYRPHTFAVRSLWFLIDGNRNNLSMSRTSPHNVLPYQALCIVCISNLQFKSTSMDVSALIYTQS